MLDIFASARLDTLGPLGFKGLELGNGEVRSAVVPFAWSGPVATMMQCSSCHSFTPGENCTCGLHAAYSVGHVIDQYAQYRGRVVVLVEGQGDVILHEHGWRAEQCAVHAIVELYAGNLIRHLMHVRASLVSRFRQ